MLEYLKVFEKIIHFCLIFMMSIVVLLSTIELGYFIVKDILTPPVMLLQIDELLNLFGLFLLVLLSVERLETLKAYIVEHIVHVEVVMSVALIAVARKVIIIDVKEFSPNTLIGIGVIVISLSVGYYLVKRTHYQEKARIKKLSQDADIA